MKAKSRPAFTLIELLTVVAIISLLISILVPALGRAREMGNRAACSANQAAIMKGLLTYAAETGGQAPNWGQQYPGFLTVGKGWDWDGTEGGPGAYSGGAYLNTTAGSQAAAVTSNTRNYYLLVRKGLADPKNFQCPSDSEGGQPFQPADPSTAHDFQRRSQLSFSMQYLNPAADGNINTPETGWALNLATADPKMVMIADKSPLFRADTPVPSPYDTTIGYVYQIPNPATDPFCINMVLAEGATTIDGNTGAFVIDPTQMRQEDINVLNSLNHRSEGQNVARIDGSVVFTNNPWQGTASDNIWTVQDSQQIDNTTPLPSLIARVAGGYPGRTALNANTEEIMLDEWVEKPVYSKNRYPDSFLVP